MATYVMLTRLSAQALDRPDSVEELGRKVDERVRTDCPGVKWLANYALLGPYDYLDIFEAPDPDTATKVSLLVRSLGHATTETWLATPWNRLLELASGLKSIRLPNGEKHPAREPEGRPILSGAGLSSRERHRE